MSNQSYQTPRGTRDILPTEQMYWQHFRKTAEETLSALGVERIDIPHIENYEIFTRGIGDNTDIVSKEMYLLESKGKEDDIHLALRPEGTAGIVRSYIQNGMSSWPQPVKLYYLGAMFRHDRPQKGRYREFFQLGVEIFGDTTPKSDYLSIMSAWEILKRLGLKNLIVHANSIGCPKCRPKYVLKLKKYYKEHLGDLCTDCNQRYSNNPLRLLDCKVEKCQTFSMNAPVMLDLLCLECKSHFSELLELLDYFQIRYDLDPKLVRGLDYYTRTVFEIFSSEDSHKSGSLGGGGRYDGLVEILGGSKTPAVGYSLGIDRIVNLMKEQKINSTPPRGVEVCILQLGEKAKSCAKHIYDELSDNSVNVLFIPSNDSLHSQLKSATKTNSKYAIIIGQAEAVKNEVILRDMRASAQETLPVKGLANEVNRRLKL